MESSYLLQFGGATRGKSRGSAGIGYVLSDPDGEIVGEFRSRLAHDATIQTAEYKALLAGLQYAKDLECIEKILIKGTRFVIFQLEGQTNRGKDPTIKRYTDTAKELLNSFASEFKAEAVSASENAHVEELAKKAIDELPVNLDAREILKECNTVDDAKKYVLKKRHQGTDKMTFILDVISGSNPACFQAIQEMCTSKVLEECGKMDNLAGRTLQSSCRGCCRVDGEEGIRSTRICMSCLLSFY